MKNKEALKCIERLLKSSPEKAATTKQKKAVDIIVDAMATRLPKVSGEALFYSRSDQVESVVPHLFWGDLVSIKDMFTEVFLARPMLQKLAVEAIVFIVENVDPVIAKQVEIPIDYKNTPYKHLK